MAAAETMYFLCDFNEKYEDKIAHFALHENPDKCMRFNSHMNFKNHRNYFFFDEFGVFFLVELINFDGNYTIKIRKFFWCLFV